MSAVHGKLLFMAASAMAAWVTIQPVFAQTSGVGADGATRLLWRGTDNRANIYKLDSNLNLVTYQEFEAVDEWFEEDERNLAHPRDPFHRIEVVHSSRSVRVERDGELLAASTRPHMVLEAPLPVRYYFPPEDVREESCIPVSPGPSAPTKGKPPIGRRRTRTTSHGAIRSLSERLRTSGLGVRHAIR